MNCFLASNFLENTILPENLENILLFRPRPITLQSVVAKKFRSTINFSSLKWLPNDLFSFRLNSVEDFLSQ